MKAIIEVGPNKFELDLNHPLDISIPMRSGAENPNAFHIQEPLFEPIRIGDYVGSVKEGSGANCENLLINAHGNGTHTECIGHITDERITINQCLKVFFAMAQVVSMKPQKMANGDSILELQDLPALQNKQVNALIIRSIPNSLTKKKQVYSGNNPCYLEPELCAYLVQNGIDHVLVDVPSVDREEDGGKMLAHKAFWNYPQEPRKNATITEMVFVSDEIEDGIYFLNLQIASLETDASPSKPVLYRLKQV